MFKNLYETFAKRWYHGGSVWIYSDPHFNDPEMVHLRKNYIGDDEQVKSINKVVGKNDTIIFLGDIGGTSFIKKIRGYKVLIMGNHDKGASNYKRQWTSVSHFPFLNKTYEEKFDFVPGVSPLNLYTKEGFLKFFGELMDKYGDTAKELEHTTNYYDNHLFDEVYEGPLMVNDRLILSHEPIECLPKYMFNIHGHDHSGWFKSDHHLNVCAETIDYLPVNLNNLLKNGLLKNIESIHRTAIDKAVERKK